MNEIPEELEDQASEVTSKVQDAWQKTSATASDTLEQGKEYVRSNQLAVLAGALAAGLVIGLLVPRKKPEPVATALETRIDDLKELLASFSSKVGSTAGDQYEGLSSILGSAVKKARKRLNIS